MSPIALVGGNEFRRDCDLMDRVLLELAGGQGASVAIVPTAATNENPYVAGENGTRHFRRLGAAADKVLIVDEATAADPQMANQLELASLIYLTSGDPMYLLETLRGSRAWEVILAVHQRGGLIVGSSAGAMVLGGQMWRFDGWAPGLGLAPSVAVLPHHATLSARWDTAFMQATLPAGTTLVGLDEATAFVLPDGQVAGIGEVTLYGQSGPVPYGHGTRVPLQDRLT